MLTFGEQSSQNLMSQARPLERDLVTGVEGEWGLEVQSIWDGTQWVNHHSVYAPISPLDVLSHDEAFRSSQRLNVELVE